MHPVANRLIILMIMASWSFMIGATESESPLIWDEASRTYKLTTRLRTPYFAPQNGTTISDVQRLYTTSGVLMTRYVLLGTSDSKAVCDEYSDTVAANIEDSGAFAIYNGHFVVTGKANFRKVQAYQLKGSDQLRIVGQHGGLDFNQTVPAYINGVDGGTVKVTPHEIGVDYNGLVCLIDGETCNAAEVQPSNFVFQDLNAMVIYLSNLLKGSCEAQGMGTWGQVSVKTSVSTSPMPASYTMPILGNPIRFKASEGDYSTTTTVIKGCFDKQNTFTFNHGGAYLIQRRPQGSEDWLDVSRHEKYPLSKSACGSDATSITHISPGCYDLRFIIQNGCFSFDVELSWTVPIYDRLGPTVAIDEVIQGNPASILFYGSFDPSAGIWLHHTDQFTLDYTSAVDSTTNEPTITQAAVVKGLLCITVDVNEAIIYTPTGCFESFPVLTSACGNVSLVNCAGKGVQPVCAAGGNCIQINFGSEASNLVNDLPEEMFYGDGGNMGFGKDSSESMPEESIIQSCWASWFLPPYRYTQNCSVWDKIGRGVTETLVILGLTSILMVSLYCTNCCFKPIKHFKKVNNKGQKLLPNDVVTPIKESAEEPLNDDEPVEETSTARIQRL